MPQIIQYIYTYIYIYIHIYILDNLVVYKKKCHKATTNARGIPQGNYTTEKMNKKKTKKNLQAP